MSLASGPLCPSRRGGPSPQCRIIFHCGCPIARQRALRIPYSLFDPLPCGLPRQCLQGSVGEFGRPTQVHFGTAAHCMAVAWGTRPLAWPRQTIARARQNYTITYEDLGSASKVGPEVRAHAVLRRRSVDGHPAGAGGGEEGARRHAVQGAPPHTARQRPFSGRMPLSQGQRWK